MNIQIIPRVFWIVIKIATAGILRLLGMLHVVLGVLGIDLRNPYPLHRQKAFIVPGIVPDDKLEALAKIPTWDEWDQIQIDGYTKLMYEVFRC